MKKSQAFLIYLVKHLGSIFPIGKKKKKESEKLKDYLQIITSLQKLKWKIWKRSRDKRLEVIWQSFVIDTFVKMIAQNVKRGPLKVSQFYFPSLNSGFVILLLFLT